MICLCRTADRGGGLERNHSSSPFWPHVKREMTSGHAEGAISDLHAKDAEYHADCMCLDLWDQEQ